MKKRKRIVGDDVANKLKDSSLKIYKKARELAEKKGIIIADTKMEFGVYEGFKVQGFKGKVVRKEADSY